VQQPETSQDPDVIHLPPDITTHHTLALPGRKLRFAANAGGIHLKDGKDASPIDTAFVSYPEDDTPGASRPVTFVSSTRSRDGVGMAAIRCGRTLASPDRSDNRRPVGHSNPDRQCGHIFTTAGDARHRLWSIGGEIHASDETIRRWLDHA
jgi:hypothetical protein